MNIKKLIKEEVEAVLKEVDVDLDRPESERGESGFCKYNPEIHDFSLKSPINLAMTLTFIYASIQTTWDRLVTGYKPLVRYILAKKGGNGLLEPDGSYPKNVPFDPYLIMGFRGKGIDNVWRNKEKIYNEVVNILRPFDYKDMSKKSEDAAFKLFNYFNHLYGLGLPKAGFATQLIIGRYGCIDSINQTLFKIPANVLTKKVNKLKQVQSKEKGLQDYLNYLEQIENLSDDRRMIKLWDEWTEIVSKKLEFLEKGKKDIIVKKGGKEYIVPAYTSKLKKAQGFYDKYKGDVSPQEISRQHHPGELYDESEDKENNNKKKTK